MPLTQRVFVFETVTLLGMGLMGGSLGLALRERRLAQRVVAVARRPETDERALGGGAASEGGSDPEAGAREAELVVLCTPVLTIPALAGGIAPRLRPGAVLSDVGSTKALLAWEVPRRLRSGNSYVGGHPMAGSEKT